MRIFIWIVAGDGRAYNASTQESATLLLNDIILVVNNWGIDGAVQKANDYINRHPDNTKAIRVGINFILDAAEIGSHEMFEYGTGFVNLENFSNE